MTNQRNARGFTLVEALVSAGLVAVIAVAIGLLSRDIFSLQSGLSGALSGQADAARVLRPFADELRSAQASASGAFAIAETSTSSVTFYADVDRDGVVERARYFVEGGEFRRAIAEPAGEPPVYGAAATTTLVRGVLASSTIFSYFPQGYDGTASSSPLAPPVWPSEVRAVRVWLSVDPDPVRPPGPAEVTTVVTVRNLRGEAASN
jgi:type II secretory pathway pseudopilin PulG